MSSDGQATRTRILDVTLDALERGEVRRLSMSGVAKLAGLSRQAVYLHFESRAQLFLAVARHTDVRHDHTRHAAPMFTTESGPELLRAFATFLADYNPLIYGVVCAAEDLRREDPDIEAAWSDRMAARRGGGRELAKRLKAWDVLADGWTVPAAGDYACTHSSVHYWAELCLTMKWPRKRFIDVTTRALSDTLLRS